MFNVKDKVAIVTGGASGIGLSAVEALLEKGAKVVIADYNDTTIEAENVRLSEKYGESVSVYKVDVYNR